MKIFYKYSGSTASVWGILPASFQTIFALTIIYYTTIFYRRSSKVFLPSSFRRGRVPRPVMFPYTVFSNSAIIRNAERSPARKPLFSHAILSWHVASQTSSYSRRGSFSRTLSSLLNSLLIPSSSGPCRSGQL